LYDGEKREVSVWNVWMWFKAAIIYIIYTEFACNKLNG